MNEPSRTATLSDYTRILREQRWLVVGCVVLCVAVAVGLSLRQATKYAASADLDFQGDGTSLSLVGTPAYPSRTNKELAELGASTLVQPRSLQQVRATLRTQRSIDELRGMVSTAVDPNSNLVRVTATSGDPQFAARLANALADQQTQEAKAEAQAQYRATAKDLRRRQESLVTDDPTRNAANAGQIQLYNDQITRLQALINLTQPVTVATRAEVPSDPVSPKPVRNAILALVAGGLLGLLLAFLRSTLDKRLRTREDVTAAVPLSLLGSVRDDALGGAGALPSGRHLEQADLEAFGILRTNLRFFDVDDPLRTIAVTSAAPGEGKSTVAASLALSYAAAGQSTLLVECDLRRPTLAGRLGLAAPDGAPLRGLTDFLAGDAAPDEVLRVVATPELATRNGHQPRPGEARAQPLVAVLAGSPTPRPAELLGSERFAAFLAQVREDYDVVILDTSPVLTVADTLQVLPRVDGALVCVRLGQTTRDEASALRDAVERVPHGPLGLVATGVRREDEPTYGYYGYADARAAAPAEPADRPTPATA